jgi:hypothetical protein
LALLFLAGKFREACPPLHEKLNNFLVTGVVQGVCVAYSHGLEHKHIQDLVNKNRSKIWECWEDQRTQVCCSGSARGIVEDIHEMFCASTINKGSPAHPHVWNIKVYTAVTSE